jgi:hypothetical protein
MNFILAADILRTQNLMNVIIQLFLCALLVFICSLRMIKIDRYKPKIRKLCVKSNFKVSTYLILLYAFIVLHRAMREYDSRPTARM